MGGRKLHEDHLGLMLLVCHGLLVLGDIHYHSQGGGEVVSEVRASSSQSQVGVPPHRKRSSVLLNLKPADIITNTYSVIIQAQLNYLK